ncbi:MAG TPA: hypothetical protein VMV65_03250 [Alphaproteobacteria bacterium]|nr:hypothetical protein [Alphaproteobacteria bacterium]
MNQSETPAKPRIIFVLGMHRSGTSLTTNVLTELGVALSEDLMPATHENARGYFESQTISFLQDRILAAFGVAWDTPTSMRALPPQWWRSPSIAPLRAQIVAFVRAELEKHPLWAFKDPRTMRMLPMWDEIVTELNAEPTYLLVTRHPNEVAGSLHARSKLDPIIAELLWLEHNVDTLLTARNRIAAIVEYQEWIDRPVEQARYMIDKLALQYPGNDEDLRAMLAGVVAPELRHHAPSNAFRLPFTGPLYDALLKRDFAAIMNLAELFNVSRSLTSTVAVPLYRKLTELTNVVNQRGARIAELESQIKASQPAPSASIAEPTL